MMTSKAFKKLGLIMLMVCSMGFIAPAYAQKAPPKLQAALFTKLLGFYTNLGSGDFNIHVVGNPEVASELKALIGAKIGKAKLSGVSEGDGPPTNGAKVIYVGASVKEITGYSQANQVLTITGEPVYVNDGVTLGVKIESGKPKILLNLTSTKAEGVNWNPQILKVASTVD